MLPALIAAGATLAGGLISRNETRRAQGREDTAIQRRVADAQRAGVHPIYALGATGAASSAGGSYFGESVARSGQAIGNALSKSLDTDQRAVKTLLLEKAGLENQLLRAQVTRAERENIQNPVGAARTVIDGQKSTMLPDIPAHLVPHKLDDPSITPNYRVGGNIRSNPNFSDAQVIQNRHGELAESAYGAISIPADLSYTIQQAIAGDAVAQRMISRFLRRDGRNRQEVTR